MNLRRRAGRLGRALAAAGCIGSAVGLPLPGAASTLPRTCETEVEPDAPRVALALRMAEAVQRELARHEAPVAIVARAGLDLDRFGLRYSHAGLSLREHVDGPWTVRQLYFACEEGRPRIFDQGLAAFLLGNRARAPAQLVAILPPPASGGAALAQAAADDALARQLLGPSYSANAHAFADLHQNCNQWVAELLAMAWGAKRTEGAPAQRAQAQAWLRASGFEPTVFDVAWPAMRLLRGWIPWVLEDDHPPQDLQAGRYRVVMPESIERFVRRAQPGAQRLEFCLDAWQRLVVREGWMPLDASCTPGPADRVVELPGSPPGN